WWSTVRRAAAARIPGSWPNKKLNHRDTETQRRPRQRRREEEKRRKKKEMEERDPLTREVIGAAIEVHREIGPGLLESVYQLCLEHELKLRKIEHLPQEPLPIVYKGL